VTRVKWCKDPMSKDLYAGPYIAGKEKYMVFITIPSLKIVIMGGGKHKELELQTKSLRTAKILAKEYLIKMGARFYDEVRNKV
jgi:hypothetical protein